MTGLLFLQNKATWGKIHHHFRPKTGHMGLYQNCTRQDSSEFHVSYFPSRLVPLVSYRYSDYTLDVQLQQCCANMLLVYLWYDENARDTSSHIQEAKI